MKTGLLMRLCLVGCCALAGVGKSVPGLASTLTWDGGELFSVSWGGTLNWNPNRSPAAGDDLVFPAGAGHLSNTNNLAAGLIIHSVSISGAGYNITGNSIQLDAGLATSYAAGSSAFGPPITLRSNQTFTLGDISTSLTLGGAMALGSHAATFNVAGAGYIHVLGNITGTGSITKGGFGYLRLAGINGYTGVTTVNNGLLEVDGLLLNSPVVVNPNGTLLGLGGVSTITSTGTIKPGGATAPGILTVGNDPTLTGGALSLRINGTTAGTDYDQLVVNAGVVSLNGCQLNLTFGYQPSNGDSFTLIKALGTTTVSGTFANLPEGAYFTNNNHLFQISYANASGVVLTTVLDPNSPVRIWALKYGDYNATNHLWSLPENWFLGLVPTNGCEVLIPDRDILVTLINDLPPGLWLTGLTIPGKSANSYDLQGNPITLTGNLIGTARLDLDLNLPGMLTVRTSPASTNFPYTPPKLTLTGRVSGPGGFTLDGLMDFGATGNSFTGPAIINSGILRVYDLASVVGPLIVNGGFALLSGSGITAASSDVTVHQPGVLSVNGDNAVASLAGDGEMDFTNLTTTYTLTVAGQGTSNSFSGIVTGAFNLEMIGNGKQTFTWTNSSNGGTLVSNGVLVLNGVQANSPVALAGGTLAGVGQVHTIATTGSQSKVLSPGDPLGALRSDSVTLSAQTTFHIELQGTSPGSGYSQLKVTGAVDLGGSSLTVAAGQSFPSGTTFIIVDNDGADAVTGTFAGLPEGATVTGNGVQFTVSYHGGTGNDVTLQVIGLTNSGIFRVWTGAGGNPNWTTPANWAGNIKPGPGDDLFFPASTLQLASVNDFPTNVIFNSLNYAYTFPASGYLLSGTNVVLLSGITNSGVNTLLPRVQLRNSGTIASLNPGDSLTLAGGLDTGAQEALFDGAGGITVSGSLRGPSGLAKSGNGTLTLVTSNSYAGNTRVLAGTLAVGHSSALGNAGASVTVSNGAALALANNVVVPQSLSLAGTVSASTGTNAWNGSITLAFSNGIVSVASNAALTINGLISGAGGLAKQLPGPLTVNANNTYTGDTVVEGGSLFINGTQPDSVVRVRGGALLGGIGRTGGLFPEQGVVSPGTNGPGLLRADGGMAFTSATTLRLELNGTNQGVTYDALSVVGPVVLGGSTLGAALGYSPALGDSFVIINNDGTDPVAGTFSGLPQGAVALLGGRYFSISYTGGSGNDVMLTCVRAPVTLDSITRLANGLIRFQGSGETGLTYAVEASSNLLGTNWTFIGSSPADGTGRLTFTDTNAALFPTRFYRTRFP